MRLNPFDVTSFTAAKAFGLDGCLIQKYETKVLEDTLKQLLNKIFHLCLMLLLDLLSFLSSLSQVQAILIHFEMG